MWLIIPKLSLLPFLSGALAISRVVEFANIVDPDEPNQMVLQFALQSVNSQYQRFLIRRVTAIIQG